MAAHWADLHSEETIPASAGPVLAGFERAVRLGGDGTPLVAEFACAELAVLMGIGCVAAEHLVADALDLRHRHPVLWAGLGCRSGSGVEGAAGGPDDPRRGVDPGAGEGRGCGGRPVCGLPGVQAVHALVEAKIVEADPAAAEARRVAEALARFVSTGQSDEFGFKTMVVKATAGDVIFFVAMCDRIAECLAADGDTDPVDVRRSKAVGILAQPALALALLQRHATGDQATPTQSVAVDPDKLRPHATLVVRLTEEALASGTGVAASNVGVLTVQQVRDLLGHCRVTVRPVLDLREQLPVDAYEVPAHDAGGTQAVPASSSVFPTPTRPVSRTSTTRSPTWHRTGAVHRARRGWRTSDR